MCYNDCITSVCLSYLIELSCEFILVFNFQVVEYTFAKTAQAHFQSQILWKVTSILKNVKQESQRNAVLTKVQILCRVTRRKRLPTMNSPTIQIPSRPKDNLAGWKAKNQGLATCACTVKRSTPEDMGWRSTLGLTRATNRFVVSSACAHLVIRVIWINISDFTWTMKLKAVKGLMFQQFRISAISAVRF